MIYYKKENDRIRFNPDTGIAQVISFATVPYLGEGTGSITVKDLNTYGSEYVIPDGFEEATHEDWAWGLSKLRIYVTSLT